MRHSFLVLILFSITVLTACGSNAVGGEENPNTHYDDEKMTGTVWNVSGDSVEVDISEWEKRDRKGANGTEEGYSYLAQITDETTIKYENGKEAFLKDLKKGQKVLVNPPRGESFEGKPKELVLLDMTFQEQYTRFLSHIDGYKLVVMYEEGAVLPPELQDPLYEKVLNLTEEEVVATWIVYDDEYVVDYKKEIGVEQFPVVLVFNREELVFKTYDVEKVYDFFEQ
ncbi:hypothetical protein FZC76_05950 [Sutcliffiella horikoshii]|uniref:Uncharacterized protein n=1 Tax=Sutcliffiella horikoshii TaxID=79883 RepID=A0A5D4T5M2_9BACI|nr:hypothetical protein [Sutcliffiella horikoshii]TYS69772.1 hypothetical protein FZC76_05950 [Sutcliffiella horikoshii]